MTKQEKDEYLNSGFTLDQVNEIQEGLESGLDISVYAKKEFFAIQMRQIRLGLEEKLPVENYASVEYDWFQMEEIRKGLQDKLDIRKYANPAISYDRMRQIRLGLEDGIDLHEYVRLEAGILRELRKAVLSKNNIVEYIHRGYDAEQLEQIRIALEKGLKIVPYLQKELRGVSIREIREGLEKGLDVSSYAKVDFGWQQMREIRLGLENRADISAYANPLYDWQQMREIRLGLESGLDISSYHTLMYTAADMREKRLKLQQKMDGVGKEIALKKQGTFKNFSLSISEDEMEVYISVTDSGKIIKEDIMKALKQQLVTRGIIEKEIDQLVSGKNKNKTVLIAQGKPSEEGAEGRYEYFFRTDLNQMCESSPDGFINFDKMTGFEFVKEGQVVAVYHDAECGASGYTVTGKELPARKGREKSVLAGKGFTLKDDQKTYVASIDGRIQLKDQRIEIDKALLIETVNRTSGTVDFNGSVMISGDVGVGSVINATGDIFINGIVEAADIYCGGDLFVRQGVNGRGKCSIKAVKNITGKFFDACQVEAGGNVIADYCLNADVSAGSMIKVAGKNGMLAGGTAYARKGIEAQSIGNRARLKTLIYLGDRENYGGKQEDIDQKIKDVTKELLIFKNAYMDFQKKYPPEIRNTMEMYLKIESAIFTKEKELGELMAEKERAEQDVKAVRNAEAVVKGTLYEGTVFDVNGKYWNAKLSQNVRVKREEGTVAVIEN